MTILERRASLKASSMPVLSSAFEEIFAQHWSPICAHCFRFVGDRDEAEDIALETFWKLYQDGIWQRENERKVRSWLYRVATNDSLNAIRGRKRRHQYELEAGIDHLDSSRSIDPAADAEQQEVAAMIRLVLSRMKKKHARVLSLRHAGLSYREVADVMQISPNSIGTLLARAENEFMQHYSKMEGR